MSDHLAVAFLLAAHQQAEELARAAADGSGSASWHTSGRESCDCCEAVRSDTSFLCVVDDRISGHIVLHDPAEALRRVAAERKILAEHQPTREAKWRGPTSLDPCDLPGCACNGVPEDSLGAWEIDGCRVCASGPWYDAVVEHWPCRTVLLLAKGWGWEEAS